MKKCLLSIDWDYFISTRHAAWGSYLENDRSLTDAWYKRYLQAKVRGEDIRASFQLSPEWIVFWEKLKKYFRFHRKAKAYVSDSHALSYQIAKEHNCKAVFLFDSHADLGYGGLSSLNFEVNCSNWLGELLKEAQVEEAHIFYSPYTTERPEFFQPMNDLYPIRYCTLADLDDRPVEVSAIHICRSGAWTPPWLDPQFQQFADSLGLPYQIENCPERHWDPDHITLAEQIQYLMA